MSTKQTNKPKPFMARQGDVLFVPLDTRFEIPNNLIKRKTNGKIVFAYGETTGHEHASPDDHAEIKDTPGDDSVSYLEVKDKPNRTSARFVQDRQATGEQSPRIPRPK